MLHDTLALCPSCYRGVSPAADVCPGCGHPFHQQVATPNGITLGTVAGALGTLAMLATIVCSVG